ncbi:hypothetical protein [Pseudonocardia alaniniphila]|uniref:Uncharacterized protein n=1 Tax=Pseudonocardia alaniniphila TaxID=75291 RepID=A0ABS9TSZ0_9PSEU|nr:hypothetical protein [Pseudonocardia alaniniphila]MCH6171672.1 hypothetical protein [Pseudonocardia alaniniphila]
MVGINAHLRHHTALVINGDRHVPARALRAKDSFQEASMAEFMVSLDDLTAIV